MMRAMGLVISKERRTIKFSGETSPKKFPSNKLNNQKYNIVTFLPKLLFNEFKFFFNMFFLLTALSQFIPMLKVGLLVTYVAPLGVVLAVTMLKEAYDDIQRYKRDRELNTMKYERCGYKSKTKKISLVPIESKDIAVG